MTDHITLPRSVVEQAIEALEDAQWIQEHHQDEEKRCDAIEALRAALAGAAQAEPFGYMLHWPKPGGGTSMLFHKTPSAGEAIGCKITPIYTAPQPAQPVAVLIPGPSGDVLTDFQHGQWWVAEIEAALLSGTSDQIRAVATLRNLLNTIQTQFNAAPTPPATMVLKPPVMWISRMDFETLKTRGRVTLTAYGEPVGDKSNEVALCVAEQTEAAHSAKLAKLNGITPPAEGGV